MYEAKVSQRSKTTRIEKFQMGTFVCSALHRHGDQRWLIKAARFGGAQLDEGLKVKLGARPFMAL